MQKIRVAMPGAGAVGSVTLSPANAGKLLISDLEVLPEHRRHGVGSMLVRAAIQTAMSHGRNGAILEANPGAQSISPQSLVSMYQKLGFRQTGLSSRGKPIMEFSRNQSVQQKPHPLMPYRTINFQSAPPKMVPGRVTGLTIQRSVMSVKELAQVASDLNESHSGKKDSRNTQAVVVTENGDTIVFTQREYKAFDESIESAEVTYGVTINERVIADHKDDEGIHSEMLAISWWLQGNIKKPKKIGVSQGICVRCQAVLDYYGITGSPKGGHKTKNWVHPHRHAGKNPPAKLKEIPQKVTKSKEYGWD